MSTLRVTNIKAADGTSGLTIANSTGVITHAAGFNNYVTASSGGGTTINPTLNGIPSWANEITVSFFDLSQAGAADTMFRAAVGGSVVTANYQYVAGYTDSGVTHSDRSAGNDGGFSFYGFTAAANNMNGKVVFTKVTGSKYVVFGEKYNDEYTQYFTRFAGRISLSGAISGISLYNSTNFDGGNVRVVWR